MTKKLKTRINKFKIQPNVFFKTLNNVTVGRSKREKVNIQIQFPSFGKVLTFFQLTGVLLRRKGRFSNISRTNTVLTKLSRNYISFNYFEYCPIIRTVNY